MGYTDIIFGLPFGTLVFWFCYKSIVARKFEGHFENWQSEFLQLMWQVAGLTFLWYVGSPQSKEEEERNDEMLQWIIKKVDPENAQKFLKEMENKFPKK